MKKGEWRPDFLWLPTKIDDRWYWLRKAEYRETWPYGNMCVYHGSVVEWRLA